MARRKTKKELSLILVIILFSVVAWQLITKYTPKTEVPSTPASSENSLVVEFLDVDQADCELLFLPDGKTVLIDAGDRGNGDEIVAYLNGKNIKKIDYLIATHPHSDHIGGMSDVINTFEIGQIFAPKLANGDVPTSKTYKEFLEAVQNKGMKLTRAKSGKTLFEGSDYKAECFAPNSDDYTELNDYSVTVKLSYGIHSFLFTGDAEALSESEMLNAGFNLDCDVLKIGHHGSSSSSSSAFLLATTPKYAVISCGEDNDYGHPHAETINALKGLPALEKTLRTDTNKTIIFTADGKTENGINFTTNHPTVVE